ncbi:MAG: hypothetical protein RMX65_012435 [Nostoc sp. DedQUE01]|nr:hypothetical protein [Nostoc sp. DedQUE01]MDZ8082839.1 hypothetical protein [Nostoc sp. DcaGUA01]
MWILLIVLSKSLTLISPLLKILEHLLTAHSSIWVADNLSCMSEIEVGTFACASFAACDRSL